MNDGGFMAISPLNPDIVFYTGNVYNSAYFVGVSHSSDGGETWEHDTIGLGTRGWAVAFDGTDTNRVYVGGDSAYSYLDRPRRHLDHEPDRAQRGRERVNDHTR
jgi:hypothetical protein